MNYGWEREREGEATLRSGRDVQISTAPAVAPAMTLRRADGFSFLLASTFSSSTGAMLSEPLCLLLRIWYAVRCKFNERKLLL